MLAAAVATAFLLPPALFLELGAYFGAPAQAVALSFLFGQAIAEEATKAVGIGLANLRRSFFSWFTLTTTTAGFMGLVERFLLAMNWRPDGGNLNDVALLLIDARSVIGHIALSLVCVMTARALHGRLQGWAAGVLIAGFLHGLTNILPRQLPSELRAELPLLAPIVSAIVFMTIIAIAFALRRNFDWRTADAGRRAPSSKAF